MRLIDADALVKLLREIRNDCSGANEKVLMQGTIMRCIRAVQMAKTVDVPHWIPCSEKEPTEADGKVIACDAKGEVNTAVHSEYSGKWYWGDMMAVGAEVIAWRPLPDPYKESEVQ